MPRMKALAMSGALMVGASMVAGCDSGGSAQLDTIAPSSVSPGPLLTLPATTAPATTEPPATTPVATLPEGAIALSPDGPWTLVDSAPGITTAGLVYELMPGLWAYLPLVEDIPNGITWTLNAEDLPIIEAYLQARLVFFKALTSSPMDFSSAAWHDFYVDGGERLIAVVAPLNDAGQVLDLDAGVVLRPTVGGDGRTEGDALVLDCILNGSVFRNSDGSLADGSTPGIGRDGQGSTMHLAGETWKLDGVADARGACA